MHAHITGNGESYLLPSQLFVGDVFIDVSNAFFNIGSPLNFD